MVRLCVVCVSIRVLVAAVVVAERCGRWADVLDILIVHLLALNCRDLKKSA